MPICIQCGREFDLEHARRSIGAKWGAGSYDEESPDGELCEVCVDEIIGEGMAAGAEIMDLNQRDWWSD